MAIKTREIYFDSSDQSSKIYAKIWSDDEVQPRFILQLAHGMCEYIERYDEFARFVCAGGGVVCGNDHLGHGNTVRYAQQHGDGYLGYFSRKDGEKNVMEDVHTLTTLVKADYPGLPLVLMGHSMGSMVARAYTVKYGAELAGAVYSGTSGANPLTGLIRFLARVGMVFGRAKKPATFLSYLAFSKYNDMYDDVQTENDWLTRDRDIVTAYNADPLCTFKFTDRAAYDFANLVDDVSGMQWAEKLPKSLPYYLISGSMDPVGNYTKGVEEVFGWMQQARIPEVQLKLYADARHEILNEVNRRDVYADVLAWIGVRLSEIP